MSTIIRTRSPYFIRTTNYVSPTYSIDYFQIAISIYEGTSGALPTCGGIYGQYTLKKKVLPNETSVTFDISEIANDHLIQTFSGTHSASAATQSFWMQVTVTGFETDGSSISPSVTNQYLIQEGFNKFKEGVNYVTEPTAMVTANHLQYNGGSNIVIPVNAERVNKVDWKFNGSIIATTTITDDGTSQQKIEYASRGTGIQEYDEALITYDTSSTRSITLSEVEECKYTKYKITFLNRWGALQDLFFFKKSIDSLDTRRENFNRSIFKAKEITYEEVGEDCESTTTYNAYSTTAHADKSFNANGRESIQLNTGFVPDSMNETFEELMVSEYVWLMDESPLAIGETLLSRVIPVKLKDISFTYKTGLNDKLINYTMNFEKAFDLVNNIR